MTEVGEVVCRSLNSFIGKNIKILNDNEKTIEGVLINFHDKDYFYEIVLKQGRYKRRFIVFYPICSKIVNDVLILDYRINKIRDEKFQELLYNYMDRGGNHPHFNKVIQICK